MLFVLQTAGAGNCTEILVSAVLDNHKALASGHHCLDQIDADRCGDFVPTDSTIEWDAAEQAQFFLPVLLETLIQNIRIVLFLEQAKKRGA